MIGPMKRPLFLLVLVCQFALGQNFSQILSGFIVPDGAQDFESVAESAGVAMPLSIYTTCQNREFYIWNGLKASTVNGLVKNLDSRIREASWTDYQHGNQGQSNHTNRQTKWCYVGSRDSHWGKAIGPLGHAAPLRGAQ